jgi:MoxR-like ATPase
MDETVTLPQLRYTGTKQVNSGEELSKLSQPRFQSSYLPSPELVEAVNLAIYLERPLLLKGEPGCGKTQLATAVSNELGLPLESWYVKSTSRAQDGLYTSDAVGRLRDAQLAVSNRLSSEQLQRMDDPFTYIRFGPLGKAFQREQRSVVLIDEIDKADIDFPNDLLLELDERRFRIEEIDQMITAKATPIVLITSNDEKDLPDAFLRRCLFHYVEFPSQQRLTQIILARFPQASQNLVEQVIERFLALREEMRKDRGDAGKKVSTSELIDWFQVLQRYPEEEALSQLQGKLPFAGILLKNWDDHVRYLGGN